jgi:hypothetical protein
VSARTALAAAALLAAAAAAHAQPYAEAFAGMTAFDSTIEIGGQKLVDQGGDAVMLGARAGWGHRWPSGVYVGFEGDVFATNGRSRACVNGDCYAFSLRSGAGAYARLGWAPDDGRSLFYIRAGAQGWNTAQGWRAVPAIGAGAEIPFARTWFVRVDGTYAADGVETYQGTLSLGVRF